MGPPRILSSKFAHRLQKFARHRINCGLVCTCSSELSPTKRLAMLDTKPKSPSGELKRREAAGTPTRMKTGLNVSRKGVTSNTASRSPVTPTANQVRPTWLLVIRLLRPDRLIVLSCGLMASLYQLSCFRWVLNNVTSFIMLHCLMCSLSQMGGLFERSRPFYIVRLCVPQESKTAEMQSPAKGGDRLYAGRSQARDSGAIEEEKKGEEESSPAPYQTGAKIVSKGALTVMDHHTRDYSVFLCVSTRCRLFRCLHLSHSVW